MDHELAPLESPEPVGTKACATRWDRFVFPTGELTRRLSMNRKMHCLQMNKLRILLRGPNACGKNERRTVEGLCPVNLSSVATRRPTVCVVLFRGLKPAATITASLREAGASRTEVQRSIHSVHRPHARQKSCKLSMNLGAPASLPACCPRESRRHGCRRSRSRTFTFPMRAQNGVGATHERTRESTRKRKLVRACGEILNLTNLLAEPKLSPDSHEFNQAPIH